ncbi:MAG TPA: metallophosphoesterase [Tepidisphaeraceae bacterium]|jgi:predicted phosphodiesterase|nr:metallophosphoesterase [Tepidisphaeraceae bacterium]
MRLLITSDLHYNHARSKLLAQDLIHQMNQAGGDALLVIGDTAAADGTGLEECLSLFNFKGPKLLVAGNHELWTHGDDSYSLLRDELPRRVREVGWQWLQDEPFAADDFAIVGSIGWYDYSFAQPDLGIPKRFYAAKISPGAAERDPDFAPLFETRDDLTTEAMNVVARWNDGRFVKLHRGDETFVDELIGNLSSQLAALRDKRRILTAIHHLPFAELLPPPHSAQWDFAKAYLGSARIGELLLKHPQVSHLYCGHSHFPARARVKHIDAINVGSGYRAKRFETLDL